MSQNRVTIYVDKSELDAARKALDEAGCCYLVEVTPDRPKDPPALSECEGRPKTWREMAAAALRATGPKKNG